VDGGVLGYDAVLLGHWFLIFLRSMLFSFSRIKQSKKNYRSFFLDRLILEDKGIVCERLGITHPVTQLDIPEDLDSPHHGCEHLKPMPSSLVLNPKKKH
jgi:hypothetical protein